MDTDESRDSFEKLQIKPWLIKQCHSLGITSPTPVQMGCIPNILSGKDCIGAAKTGSGKTFAFALPILQHLSDDPYGIFALVLTPTHELAHQIGEQFSVLGQPMNLRVCVVTGGSDQMYEGQALSKRPHIVVAMPGRLADHISGCDTFTLKKIKYLVIDEADRLLSGSFDEDLKKVLEVLPTKKQVLLFSATITEHIKDNQLFTINSENLATWTEEAPQVTVTTLDQRYVICPAYARDVFLVEVLRTYMKENEKGNMLIFTTTKKDCQLLSTTLNAIGLENVCLHGYMRQRERTSSLTRFRSREARALVATNVASRGLDIPAVDLVVNHKMPLEPNEYIHRVGRTARAGRSGLAISLITPSDLLCLGAIEEKIKTKLTEYKIDEMEAAKIFTQVSVTKREAEINLDNEEFDERAKVYRRKNWILKDLNPDLMEAEFLKMVKRRKRETKEQNNKKFRAMKNSAMESVNKNSTEGITTDEKVVDMKAVNKRIMKTDDRFKNIPRKLAKINKKTAESKLLVSVAKTDGKPEKIDLISKSKDDSKKIGKKKFKRKQKGALKKIVKII
ncbi:putative ATP-dependent RNA helicase Dbp45A [Arctopsyche grandis]|uniref:putative ATP-dependent RNA helicase Dbp45A n=1 Tax=Arctopsyche grandis TaxID=121162 RepID=UPI00406D7F10